MTATLEVQPNTLVALPDVSASALREIVARMQAQEPAQAARDRIGRAIGVILGSEIRETGETGVYLVQSSADGGTYYRATSYSCGCPDRQRTGRECKHNYALTILHTASAA